MPQKYFCFPPLFGLILLASDLSEADLVNFKLFIFLKINILDLLNNAL